MTNIPNGWASSPVELLSLNVNEHIEKKNNLTYLSWAWAWAEALKADPTVNFIVHMFDGKPFMDVNGSAMVWVTVNMFSKPITCFLPVMDFKNQCIQTPDAVEINKTIMRCLTKAIAFQGLGLYIYAGEDLPEGEEKPVEKPETKPRATPKTSGEKDAEADLETMRMFVQSIRDFIGYCPDEPDLISFWKNNQHALDELKAGMPQLHAEVVEMFKQAKADLKEKANG